MSTKIYLILGLILITILIFRISTIKNIPDSNNFKISSQVTTNPYLSYDKIVFNLGRYRVTSSYQNIEYGDNLSVEGKKVGTEIEAKKVVRIEKGQFETALFNFRKDLETRINDHFPQPQSNLLAGILLGIKTNLPREFKQDLITTGTIHVVVVSGYNIVLIGSFVLLLAPIVGRKRATILALITITAYTFLVGFGAPTVRALIMGAVALVAVLLGKRSLGFYSLFLAVFVMLLFNPEFILDISFQLTFAATLGVMLFTRKIASWLKKFPKWFAEVFATSLAAQILVLPLIFYYFGSISVMSPIVNSFVLWTVPINTILGFVFLGLTFISNILANLASYILVLPLTFFTATVSFFGQASFLVLNFEKGNMLSVLGYFLLVLAFIPKLMRQTK